MSPDQRSRVRHGPFSTWQWAVLGAYLVALVLSISVGWLAHRADENAMRGNAAICVVSGFLRNSLAATENAIRRNPDAPETPTRRVSAANLRDLVGQLETEVPSCREALR